MPSLYETDPISVHVDWNADDDYGDTLEDVSPYWETIRFGFGTPRRSNPQRPTIAAGRGQMVLNDPRFVPGESTALTDAQLRARRKFRVRSGSVLLCDGWIQDGRHQEHNTVGFQLEGFLDRPGRERKMIAQGTASVTSTTAAVLKLLRDAYGLAESDFTHNLASTPLSLYSFNGPVAQYASQFGQVAGGLPIARRAGALAVIDPTRLPSPSPTVYRERDYTILGATTESDSEQLWNVLSTSYPSVIDGMAEATVRSTASANGNSTSDGEPPQATGTVMSQLVDGLQEDSPISGDDVLYMTYRQGDQITNSMTNFPVTLSIPAPAGNQSIISGSFRLKPLYYRERPAGGGTWTEHSVPESIVASGTSDEVVAGSVQGDGSLQATISARFARPSADLLGTPWWDGSRNTRSIGGVYYRVTAEYKLEIPDSAPVTVGNDESIDEWDPRTLEIPGWIDRTATTTLQARIDAYATPRDIHVVDFALWQPDATKTRRVAGIQPGDFMGLRIEDSYTRTDIDAFVCVMYCEYVMRRHRIPIKRLICIEYGGADKPSSGITQDFFKLVSGDFFLLSDGSKLELVG